MSSDPRRRALRHRNPPIVTDGEYFDDAVLGGARALVW